jgi:hypothetical protein
LSQVRILRLRFRIKWYVRVLGFPPVTEKTRLAPVPNGFSPL